MAYLAAFQGKVSYLSSLHTIGRLPNGVDLCVSRPEVSRYHATIKWLPPHWCIRDISLNGTWLNQKKITKNKDYRLKVGDLIHFGSINSQPFTFKDDANPVDFLISEDDTITQSGEVIHLDKYHLFPEETAPTIAIFKKDHVWQIEDLLGEAKAARPLKNKEWIQIGDNKWQIRLANEDIPTLKLEQGLEAHEIHLNFYVSLDEESTKLVISTPDNVYDLLTRAHHYLALQLARYRALPQQSGIDTSEQGWVHTDILAKELGMDVTHLNIQIHRARKQACETIGLTHSSFEFIQRRAGKIRLACPNITVFKGGKLESSTGKSEQKMQKQEV